MAHQAGLIKQVKEEAKAMTPAQVAELPRLPLSAFGGYPLNPDHRSYDIDELQGLADSIRVRGVVSPVIVADRSEIVRLDPQMDEILPKDVQVIYIDGHRRGAASELAGLEDLPYLLRNDFADPAILAEIFITSNVHALKLTAVEEAEGYARLAKYRGATQTEIAALVGKSQAHIAKTLSLLKLPQVVQTAINKGKLVANAARQLLDIPEEHREAAFQAALAAVPEPADASEGDDYQERLSAAVKGAINRVRLDQQNAAAAAKSRDALAREGVPEIDPDVMFGADRWLHELHEDQEVAAVRASGDIAGAVVHDTGRITYFSTPPAPRHNIAEPTDDGGAEPPSDAQDYSNGIAAEHSGEKAAEYSNGIAEGPTAAPKPVAPPSQEERAAIEAALLDARTTHDQRVAAMKQIVKKFELGMLADVLADTVLAAGALPLDTSDSFSAEVGIDISPEAVVELLMKGTRPNIHRAALAKAFGVLEAEAARTSYVKGGPWPVPVQRHVRRLADLGVYTLTDYDNARLIGTE